MAKNTGNDMAARILAGIDDEAFTALTGKKRELPSAEDSFNAIFGIEKKEAETEGIQQIKVDDILNHPKQAYRVKYEYDELNQKIDEFCESIKEHGVLQPLILTSTYGDMDLEGKYILVAGQKRLYAAKKAGLETVPAIVKKMSEEDADIQMRETNSYREVILPSEKAKGYKVEYDARKRQGQRTDLTFVPLEQKLSSLDLIADNSDDSKSQIQRYIRLNDLIPQWLRSVDNKVMSVYPALSIRAGVALSYLSHKEQEAIYGACEAHNVKELPEAVANEFKKCKGTIDIDLADRMIKDVFEKKEKPQSSLKFFSKGLMKKTDEFFPKDDMYKTPEIREKVITEALAEYFKKRKIEV